MRPYGPTVPYIAANDNYDHEVDQISNVVSEFIVFSHVVSYVSYESH